MSRFVTAGALALAIGFMGSASAFAQSSVAQTDPATNSNTPANSQAVLQHVVPAVKDVASKVLGAANQVVGGLPGSAPLSSNDLSSSTGGSNLTLYGAVTDQTLQATNTDNQLSVGGALTNGAVTLQANAFSGFSGIGNFVVNTGNLNNVQGALNVNVTMTPATH